MSARKDAGKEIPEPFYSPDTVPEVSGKFITRLPKYIHAKLAQVSQAGVFLVPQVALTRDPRGTAQVYVLSNSGTAELRPVTATRTQGDAWVVTGGLKDGDRVITQGLGKVKAGKPVKAVPASAPQVPQKPAASKPG